MVGSQRRWDEVEDFFDRIRLQDVDDDEVDDDEVDAHYEVESEDDDQPLGDQPAVEWRSPATSVFRRPATNSGGPLSPLSGQSPSGPPAVEERPAVVMRRPPR